jgi:hypothetical protein
MQIEYLFRTGVVQTTKVEGPVPETGYELFDLSLLLHRCRSLALLFAFTCLTSFKSFLHDLPIIFRARLRPECFRE